MGEYEHQYAGKLHISSSSELFFALDYDQCSMVEEDEVHSSNAWTTVQFMKEQVCLPVWAQLKRGEQSRKCSSKRNFRPFTM
jgi:hypothetical protein